MGAGAPHAYHAGRQAASAWARSREPAAAGRQSAYQDRDQPAGRRSAVSSPHETPGADSLAPVIHRPHRPIGRVLVVDDDEVIRHLIEVNLTLEGFEVVTAVDGQ